MNEQPDPCPFCAKRPEELIDEDYGFYIIRCENLDCVRSYLVEDNKEEAIKKWNTRHNPEAELLEKYKSFVKKIKELYIKDKFPFFTEHEAIEYIEVFEKSLTLTTE